MNTGILDKNGMEDYSKDYLDGKFGAIPIIKHIIDWDNVWKEYNVTITQ